MSTVSETAGTVVWYELPADDTARAREFYSGLFGWQFERWPGPTEYHVNGMGAIKPANGTKGALVYFGTDDIDSSAARVRELGGSAADVQEIPGTGRFAECVDTEGNAFALYQASA
jgi:uncharacterized protein